MQDPGSLRQVHSTDHRSPTISKEKYKPPVRGIATKIQLCRMQTAISNKIFMKKPNTRRETSSLNLGSATKQVAVGRFAGFGNAQTELFTTDREQQSVADVAEGSKYVPGAASHIFSMPFSLQRPPSRKLSFTSKASSMVLQKRSSSPKVEQPAGDREPNIPKIYLPRPDKKANSPLNNFITKLKPKTFDKPEKKPEPRDPPEMCFAVSAQDTKNESADSSCMLNCTVTRNRHSKVVLRTHLRGEEAVETSDRGKKSSDIEGLSSHQIIVGRGLLRPPKLRINHRKSASAILNGPNLGVEDTGNAADSRTAELKEKIKLFGMPVVQSTSKISGSPFRSIKWIDPGPRCEEDILQEWKSIL